MNIKLSPMPATPFEAVHAPAEFGSNRFIEPNEQLLLEIESLGVQTIFARLEFYEGPLDFPLV